MDLPLHRHEEGIERVVWCDAETFADNLRSAFPTVRRVGQALEAMRVR